MLGKAALVYRSTRKKHDQLWNVWVARPAAAVLVAAVEGTRVTPNQLTLASLVIFVGGAALLALQAEPWAAWAAVGVLELSYLFDCADGMLARFRKTASKEGHLFDFFTDEAKALCLVAALSFRLYRTGGLGPSARGLEALAPLDPLFLGAGVLGVLVVASGISLTNFVRRPELSGSETPVDAHYEAAAARAASPAALVVTFLRFLNHYPSHVWLFALAGRLDAFFWMYLLLGLAHLGRGWLGLFVRFGRFLPR